jgi:hypothetical protein
MARFNEILAGRYNRFLQKLFVLKGGPPSAQLASEVMPVFPFFTGVEHRYLEGWDRFGNSSSQAGVAAVVSGIRLRNPLASGTIAVVEKIFVHNAAAAVDQPLLQIGAIGTDLNTITTMTGVRLDSRGRPNPTLINSRSAAVSAVNLTANLLQYALNANTQNFDLLVFEEQEITMLPGDALQVISNTVNTQMSVSFFWRERALEESELK